MVTIQRNLKCSVRMHVNIVKICVYVRTYLCKCVYVCVCVYVCMFVCMYVCMCVCMNVVVYRVSQEEGTKLRESVPYVELYLYNPKTPISKVERLRR